MNILFTRKKNEEKNITFIHNKITMRNPLIQIKFTIFLKQNDLRKIS